METFQLALDGLLMGQHLNNTAQLFKQPYNFLTPTFQSKNFSFLTVRKITKLFFFNCFSVEKIKFIPHVCTPAHVMQCGRVLLPASSLPSPVMLLQKFSEG